MHMSSLMYFENKLAHLFFLQMEAIKSESIKKTCRLKCRSGMAPFVQEIYSEVYLALSRHRKLGIFTIPDGARYRGDADILSLSCQLSDHFFKLWIYTEKKKTLE